MHSVAMLIMLVPPFNPKHPISREHPSDRGAVHHTARNPPSMAVRKIYTKAREIHLPMGLKWKESWTSCSTYLRIWMIIWISQVSCLLSVHREVIILYNYVYSYCRWQSKFLLIRVMVTATITLEGAESGPESGWCRIWWVYETKFSRIPIIVTLLIAESVNLWLPKYDEASLKT